MNEGPIVKPLHDWSGPLVAARLALDPLLHALLNDRLDEARAIAREMIANLTKVIEWIDAP